MCKSLKVFACVMHACMTVGIASVDVVTLVPDALADSGEQGSHRVRMVYDDFQEGFSADTPTSKWFYFSTGSFVGNDGIESTSGRGLHVRAAGTNSATGEPAFSKTLAPESQNGGIPGGVDHVKWLVYANHLASSGFPGFDAIRGKEVACEWRLGGRTFGNRFHPFGNNVHNAHDDLRLSAYAATTIDFETFMVFDWLVTNETVYAFYERLPFGRGPTLGDYAAFSFSIPVAQTRPGQEHHFKTAYDRTNHRVRWVLDGEEVFSVNRLGFRIDRKYMTLDHGGTEMNVRPRQLLCGMGMFTLLDAHLPSKIGLVKLSEAPGFYFNPELGQPKVETFVDPLSLSGSRLFGQGAELEVKKVIVSYTDIRDRDQDQDDADDED